MYVCVGEHMYCVSSLYVVCLLQVALFRALLSTSNRFFFFIAVIVMIVILYIIHHLGDSSTIKMHILPNYDKMVGNC